MSLAALPPRPADLAWRLAGLISRSGPITVANYMELCLQDPAAGYYATRPALGARGDFITAPLVSQMFGELLGLWAAEVWRALGHPARFHLVELGPGDGTLMSDVLRAGRAAPGFLDAAKIVLVERSVPLRKLQAASLASGGATWLESLSDLAADRPAIVLANEFLDCLPVRQSVRTADGWAERGVGIDQRGRLVFSLSPNSEGARAPPGALAGALPGAVFEWSPALEEIGRGLGALMAEATGAALLIDYGRDAPGLGDTLQALRGHRRRNPLAAPGGADLTAHVDFPSLIDAARQAGALAPPLRSQGDFLRALGIEKRAAVLAAARADLASVIGRQVERLTATDQMGDLFKACCLHSAGLAPPGFAVAT